MLIFWAVQYQSEPSRAMFGYLYGFIVSLTLGLGCLGWVIIQFLTRAGWSVVIRRIPETIISLMPIFIVLFIPIALNLKEIFPWTHADHIDETLAKKLPYLNVQFFLIRSFSYLILWAIMGVWYYRMSIGQDRGNKYEHTRLLQAVAAPGVILFALSLTFAAFDWVMSLQPHWYSTIFGVYFFAGSHLFALAFITLMCMVLQKAKVLQRAITPEHYHDLGKLMFGFTIFWAYIAFSQFMLYWYGNIPEEIEYYAHRLHHGWEVISWAMPIIHFFVPFLALMSRFLKRIKAVLVLNCCWIIGVHLIDLYWLILPGFSEAHDGASFLKPSLVDFLGLFGIFALFFGSFLALLGRRSVVAIGDPRLRESLAFENF
ncbi:MAG TPA: hypothetical protein VEK06_04085, partial [Myxococcota bacterium]|nr:hypothetical protein [Myxococcota bacterium]